MIDRSCRFCENLTSFGLEGHICIECGAHLNVDEISERNDCRKWTRRLESWEKR